MQKFLNSDERIVCGMERFKKIKPQLSPAHFDEEVFFNPTQEQTNILSPGLYADLHEKWKRGAVCLIGDKTPNYYHEYNHLYNTFPDAVIIVLVRSLPRVASSYNVRAKSPTGTWQPENDYRRAVIDWNASLRCLMKMLQKEDRQSKAELSRLEGGASGASARRFFIVHYDEFYCGNQAYLEALYDHLQLPLLNETRDAYTRMVADWDRLSTKPLMLDDDMRAYLDKEQDATLEAWRRKHIESLPH